jgi:predicted membrane protein
MSEMSTIPSTLSLIVTIGVLILATKFPILFLIAGLFSLFYGIYILHDINSTDTEKLLEARLLGIAVISSMYILAWSFISIGIISIFIFFVMQFMNRNKGANSSVTNFSRSNAIKRNYVNTNRYVKN